MNKMELKNAYTIIIGILMLIFITSDDKDFYNDIKDVTNTESYIVLVNKNNKLNENYIPNDLEMISLKYSYENKYLRKIVKEAFEKLSYDANMLGYRIVAVSAYRSYEYQGELFNHYLDSSTFIFWPLGNAKLVVGATA